ncbi:MAG: ribosome silencing factor [Erysipelotrichaceae bacterium]|nr:ribosome silencing factor [Erysipelotrichaceae bacterium]
MSDLLNLIVKTLDAHHASKIEVLDFTVTSPLYDYSVIASVSNQRLAHAVLMYVEEEVEKHGYPIRKVEGDDQSRWLLLDCYEVVVHIFVGEERDVYQLEKLWNDLPRIEVNV